MTNRMLVPIKWSPETPPDKECYYDHIIAETPFGNFLLTWKGWKSEPWQNKQYGFDETPWGEVEYHGWNSIEEAKAWAELEMARRVNECLAEEEGDEAR